ncbi:MAG: 2-phospho-L-lactate transferase CofD family protein [Candidatus Shapirobacteria bacterium]|nr:2-phospho-L-lactate transferase CofD family protein [Candidatus Shapirobacteria bacterium]
MNKEIKVCTIGGGTAMPIINKGLIRAGFTSIKSIVSTFDSGGYTGRIRTDERGQVLAFSDYWRSLISLWNDGEQKRIWEEMLRYRDGRGRNFGDTFFQFLSEKEGNLGEVDELFSKLTGAKLAGEVIPVSLSPSDVCFTTMSGKTYKGENFVDDLRMSGDVINNIWLEPQVDGNKKAKEIMKNADLIIVGPGTTYGSVLPNFLPNGIVESYNKSKAKKIFLVNIFSMKNEVKKSSQNGYLEIFKKYLKNDNPFDLMVVVDLDKLNTKKLLKEVFHFYELENSSLVEMDKKCLIKTIKADIAIVEESNMRLRHGEEKLAKFFETLEI